MCIIVNIRGVLRHAQRRRVKKMKRVAVVIPKGAVLPAAVVGSYMLFSQVNQFLAQQGAAPAFEVVLAGYKKMAQLDDGPFTVKTDCHFRDMEKADLIIIPGFTGDALEPVKQNLPLITWMGEQYRSHGTELASMCTGAFLIAATGHLDGKTCTTHWAFVKDFQNAFPDVNLLPEHIVTDDHGIYSSAGAYSSLNLILYLIEKYCSKDLAVMLSRVYQIDLERNSQLPFIIFNRQKTHDDQPIHMVQEYIEKNYQQRLQVNSLATRFNFSRRNLIRRFKEATGNTPIEYIQRVRVESAKRMLESTTHSIDEIISFSGYNDSRTFRNTFRKYTGFSPSGYRDKYYQRNSSA